MICQSVKDFLGFVFEDIFGMMSSMKYSYKIHKNIYQDAWNWWSGCNSFSHGIDWSKSADPNVVKAIKGKSRKEADRFLIPYLKEKYIRENNEIKKARHNVILQFNQNFEKGCAKIVDVMGKPLYRNEFHFYLTTFWRAPYNKKKGWIWFCVYWKDAIDTFLHELCHFQFIHYWGENPQSSVSKLTNEQFEFLKESLTMILDEAFFPIITKQDQGYDIHQAFRKKLIEFWKKEKDFDKLVEYGVREILAS